MTDLTTDAFLVLREEFFRAGPVPRAYKLRDKRNTQDDPFDEHVQELLARAMPKAQCLKAPGPLITPDLVMLRRELCDGAPRATLQADPKRIVGIEVKKLERQRGGAVARASGMDYNTTPPCGTVLVYDRESEPLRIKGFYLFVCQEAVPDRSGVYHLTALTLCDGNLLNADFDLYLAIVGKRTKKIGLGTYGDGADRNRPMLIFANPLGTPALDHQATLVHARDDLERAEPRLRRVGIIRRTTRGHQTATFHCYRTKEDARPDTPFDLLDPFPTPERSDTTQARGQFRLDIAPAG